MRSAKLDYLGYRFGLFHEGHRARADVDMLLALLARAALDGEEGILSLLLAYARAPSWRVHAMGLPIENKDYASARGYRWNDGKFSTMRAWWIETRDEHAERNFLASIGWRSPKVVRRRVRERYRSLAARADAESDHGTCERPGNGRQIAMKMLGHGPLTEDEVRELDEFLLDAVGIEESMDVSTLDGFLTAIVCGPRTILPSEWMRWMWDRERGEDTPTFKDHDEAQRIVGLLMRHMNDIAATLHDAREDYEPLLLENPNDGDPIPIIDEWCSGFIKGVELDAEGWAPLLVGKPEWMSTILLYGTEDGWEALEAKKLSLDEHKALADGLADTVRNIHALWLEQRREPIARGVLPDVRREPVRNPSKVGRNAPCPCGSGKKFKQCHGSADRLH
jgi:uncharacterized protein